MRRLYRVSSSGSTTSERDWSSEVTEGYVLHLEKRDTIPRTQGWRILVKAAAYLRVSYI